MSFEIDPVDAFERRQRLKRTVFRVVGGVALAAAVAPCSVFTVRCARDVGGEFVRARREREASSASATAEQRAAVERDLRLAARTLDQRTREWRASMSEVAADLATAPLGPCPMRLPVRPPVSAQRGGSFNNLDQFDVVVAPGEQGFPFVIADEPDLPDEPPRVSLARKRIVELREQIARQSTVATHAARVAQAAALVDGSFWTYDVVLFADTWISPRAVDGGRAFTPGALSGIAVVYDYATRTPRCSAALTATTTSTSIEYSAQLGLEIDSLQRWLESEFDAEVERAIAHALNGD